MIAGLRNSFSIFFKKLLHLTRSLLNRYQPSETTTLLATGLLVGISTGLGAIAFVWLIAQFQLLFFSVIQNHLA
jgi:hypothetical protein